MISLSLCTYNYRLYFFSYSPSLHQYFYCCPWVPALWSQDNTAIQEGSGGEGQEGQMLPGLAVVGRCEQEEAACA